MAIFQHTLKKEVVFSGIGLHTGEEVSVKVAPAPVDTGLQIRRADLGTGYIPCDHRHVVSTAHATTLGSDGWSVSTVEHLLAALTGLGVDNAYIDVEGPEVPAMDGSAAPFVYGIQRRGLRMQRAPRRWLEVEEELLVVAGGGVVCIEPAPHLSLVVEIDFPHPVVAAQHYEARRVTASLFVEELAKARTFGFLKEVEWLRSRGLALGGSLANAVVVGDEGVLNSEGLRFDDEFVRHKALDLLGDLALAGGPLKARVTAIKAGHALHQMAVRNLMEGGYCRASSPASLELQPVAAPAAEVSIQLATL